MLCYASRQVWAANGYWYVGKRDELGKQAGWMQVRDSASLPEEISGVWQIWNQADKRWMPSEGLKVTAVGNIQVSITCSISASPAAPPHAAAPRHAHRLRALVRRCSQRAVLQVHLITS
jgi:hypothetical protein